MMKMNKKMMTMKIKMKTMMTKTTVSNPFHCFNHLLRI
jgi:hypothetical protein